ncbi:MAG: hypothetical protein E7070_07385 [Bacteroidales bacterium]|nr:hypothetical protein [Bacteroidales bacterium]
MKEQQIKRLKGALVGILLLGITTLSASAQSADGPKGMYKLKEIVQQDGKHVEADFLQYKYCLDNYTFTLGRNFPKTGVHSFNLGISNPDGKPLTYTGELSKTENKGIQTFATSDSTFTERWFNDRSDFNPRLFPFQTNIDEIYERVDSSDAMQQAMNLLQMKLGDKTHPLHGVWKLRGMQTKGTATSQYWVVPDKGERYTIFGSNNAAIVVPHPNFPKAQMNCFFTPCNYLKDNVIDCDGQAMIVHWFDDETISITRLGDDGRPFVTIWDRCGLPQNIQQVFGTEVPQMTKDVSRFMSQSFVAQYGQQPDSIQKAFETFDFAIDANERNNAIFPVLMRNGFADEYTAMKDSLFARLMRAEISVDEAVGRYVYWFYKDFDRHTHCNAASFRKLQSETLVDYSKHITKYAPEPVGCKVNDDTYLLRLPSCMGEVPTWDWLTAKAEEFKQLGCKNLILDLRGNGGGSDQYSLLFTSFMGSSGFSRDDYHYFRNSFENRRILKMWRENWNNAENDSVYADALRNEEGSLITWRYWQKGMQKYEPLVRKAAIIVDNMSASAAESPVHFVRIHNGSRAKVYGKERTMGCEQSGNCNTVRLPHSNIILTYPMTVYGTFEEACKERNPGHKPDVIIPLPYPEQLTGNIDSWVLWVAKKM